MTQYETIVYEVAEQVATITLDRPHVRNAFNPAMCDEFADLWPRVRDDDEVRVVVLRANGPVFCSGIDTRDRRPVPANPWNVPDPGAKLCPKQAAVWKPLICAVHGVAAGGAFYWLNEADMILCSADAEFFDPHLSIGLTTSLTAIGMVRHGIALRDALRMALLSSDERISARRAHEIGLVSEVVERDRLWDRAHELARLIAVKPPAAVQGSVRAIWSSLDVPWPEARRLGLAHSAVGNPVARRQADADG